LKKAYSALSQTTQRAIADYGPITTWEIGSYGSGQAAQDFNKKYLFPYLSILKDCGTDTSSSCSFTYSFLNRTTTETLGDASARFYLSDGTFIATFCDNGTTVKRFRIYIDINGQKKPNKVGKDVFYFNYTLLESPSTEGKITPDGFAVSRTKLVQASDYNCNKLAPNYGGMRCATLIMKDGWRIADDYPW